MTLDNKVTIKFLKIKSLLKMYEMSTEYEKSNQSTFKIYGFLSTGQRVWLITSNRRQLWSAKTLWVLSSKISEESNLITIKSLINQLSTEGKTWLPKTKFYHLNYLACLHLENFGRPINLKFRKDISRASKQI